MLTLDDCARLGHPNVSGLDCPCGAVSHRPEPLPRATFHLDKANWGFNAKHAASQAARARRAAAAGSAL